MLCRVTCAPFKLVQSMKLIPQFSQGKMSTQILTKKIKLENELHEHTSISDEISRIFPKTKVHAISVDYDETPLIKNSLLKYTGCSHGLYEAILHAYNKHQHLRLTPDDIWLTIAQGVSRHINLNAEKFRHYFVNHEGKERIVIFAGDILRFNENHLLKGDWLEVVNRLVVETDQAVEKVDIKTLLECDFSTTTKNSLTASRIVLLDTVKAYFSFGGTMCGIPKVTLEGTLEDWLKVQEKVIRLRQLNLDFDFWLDKLEPVICKLIETYKGKVDEEFWAKIVSEQFFGSGSHEIGGWVLAFYPYKKNGNKMNCDSFEPEDIPDGRVEVPFDVDGLPLKFVVRFLGAQQETLEDSNEVIASPVIGWYVINDEKDDDAIYEE